jgi:hypothetical protein
MKMALFWIVAPCNLVATSSALMMETIRTSETLVNFYQTTRRYNPEDSHLLRNPCLKRFLHPKQVMRYNGKASRILDLSTK